MNELLLPFWPDGGTALDVARGYHRPPDGMYPKTIVDLGANIGLTLVDFAQLYPWAQIVGAELDSSNAEVAAQNTAPYDNVEVVNVGIAAWDGGCNYNATNVAPNAFHISGEGDAPCLTIDTFIDRYVGRQVDYMKVDIEGAEREIFTLPARWPELVNFLSVETHYGYEPDVCADDLRAFGYQIEIHNFGPHEPGAMDHLVVWAWR